jgi:hypothetical protein
MCFFPTESLLNISSKEIPRQGRPSRETPESIGDELSYKGFGFQEEDPHHSGQQDLVIIGAKHLSRELVEVVAGEEAAEDHIGVSPPGYGRILGELLLQS